MLTDQHVLLAKARREKIEQEVAERAGRLLDASTLTDLLEKEYRIVSERMLSVAAMASDKLEPLDVARHERIRSVIHDAIIQILTELAAPAALIERTQQGNGRSNHIGNGKADGDEAVQ